MKHKAAFTPLPNNSKRDLYRRAPVGLNRMGVGYSNCSKQQRSLQVVVVSSVCVHSILFSSGDKFDKYAKPVGLKLNV